MKVCENCGEEIDGHDIDTMCPGCAAIERIQLRRNAKARRNRRARESVLRDCGMVKVRGALGGTYWE